MGHRISMLRAACLLAVLLATAPVAARAAGDGPLAHDPTLLREETVRIEPERIKSWLRARRGERIALPWLDGAELGVTVNTVEQADKFTVLTGTTEAKIIGTVVLTVGEGVLVGAITIDGEAYRLRSRGDDVYSLVQVNPGTLTPDNDDTASRGGHRPPLRDGRHDRGSITLDRVPEHKLKKMFNAELVDTGNFRLFETGSRIDVLIVYTREASDWASDEGLNLEAEITTMVGLANGALAASAIVPRLNIVAMAHTDHNVVDPAKLAGDLDMLAQGTGNLAVVHDLRDMFKADVVVLLVLNGTGPCSVDAGTACGRARVPDRFIEPFDEPGSPQWEFSMASNGFAVMGIYAAFNGYTFMHEIGHTLGAHHDKYTFIHDNSDPTADSFARGWILGIGRARTVMAYDRICEIIGVECEILPVFSNPLQSYLGDRRGDPAPGETPTNFGPADNHLAINRMAQTVANYRISFGP